MQPYISVFRSILLLAASEDRRAEIEQYEIYQEALKKDGVPFQYLKCYLVGIPQIGKTTLKYRLVGLFRNLSDIGGKAGWKSTDGVDYSYVIVNHDEELSTVDEEIYRYIYTGEIKTEETEQNFESIQPALYIHEDKLGTSLSTQKEAHGIGFKAAPRTSTINSP